MTCVEQQGLTPPAIGYRPYGAGPGRISVVHMPRVEQHIGKTLLAEGIKRAKSVTHPKADR